MTNKHNRRKFLKTLSGLGMAGMLPPSALAQMAGSSGAILKRAIPGTSEMLPMVGLGSSAAVVDIVKSGPDIVTQLIEIMVKHGASVIDTAPRPQAIDTAFAKVLSDPRWKDKLFVTSKMGRGEDRNNRSISQQQAIDQVRNTRSLFNRHPADLIFIDGMLDMDVHWPTLRDLKDKGDARYIGYTMSNTVGHEDMIANIKKYTPDIIAVNYSMVEPDAEQRILPMALDMGIGVIIITPFSGGGYFQMVNGKVLPDWAADFDCTSWAQFNLKYLLGDPAVTSIVTETVKPHHLEENILTATGRLPDEATRKKMKEFIASLV
ncbi:MAG: aldo/keto reductase [Gammaproteobacteria bacterium]|jgi:aryl-alcohol dehydrogenase-like predicted oxidoreductase